ncbi:zinc finger protein 665 isoform X2 [Nematostella vectensis]|uniref:zinc finger protein 665 isoform X2 n=1 Tax=Nematostella vectensis TaxID=45351 RepID=UPI002076E822|nr:zinc finger protein 665 isoform X2 [Nematostella vectensis]
MEHIRMNYSECGTDILSQIAANPRREEDFGPPVINDSDPHGKEVSPLMAISSSSSVLDGGVISSAYTELQDIRFEQPDSISAMETETAKPKESNFEKANNPRPDANMDEHENESECQIAEELDASEKQDPIKAQKENDTGQCIPQNVKGAVISCNAMTTSSDSKVNDSGDVTDHDIIKKCDVKDDVLAEAADVAVGSSDHKDSDANAVPILSTNSDDDNVKENVIPADITVADNVGIASAVSKSADLNDDINDASKNQDEVTTSTNPKNDDVPYNKEDVEMEDVDREGDVDMHDHDRFEVGKKNDQNESMERGDEKNELNDGRNAKSHKDKYCKRVLRDEDGDVYNHEDTIDDGDKEDGNIDENADGFHKNDVENRSNAEKGNENENHCDGSYATKDDAKIGDFKGSDENYNHDDVDGTTKTVESKELVKDVLDVTIKEEDKGLSNVTTPGRRSARRTRDAIQHIYRHESGSSSSSEQDEHDDDDEDDDDSEGDDESSNAKEENIDSDDNSDDDDKPLASVMHQCDWCNGLYRKISDLTKHIAKVHQDAKPYRCDLCTKGFKRRSCMTRHRALHTEKRPFKCPNCSKAFKTSYALTSHQVTHSASKPYKCQECGQEFARQSQLNDHRLKHTGETPFVCEVCSKSFTTSRSMVRHMLTHSEDRPYQCDVCGKSYKCYEALTKHTTTHSKKPYKCNVCDKSYTRQKMLTDHMYSHEESGTKIYRCVLCDDVFDQIKELTKHQRTHKTDAVYKCQECDKKFRRISGLKDHLLTHRGERPFQCSTCSKSYSTSRSLVRHERSHSSEKPYLCSDCGKAFQYSRQLSLHKCLEVDEACRCTVCDAPFCSYANLSSHFLSHPGKEPPKCNRCKKKFSSWESFTSHTKIHSERDMYLCVICEKTFKRSTHLSEHMLNHSSDQPFGCTHCSEKFKVSSMLTKHMRSHKDFKPYRCDKCDKSFNQSRLLSIHSLTHKEKKTVPKPSRSSVDDPFSVVNEDPKPYVCNEPECWKTFKTHTNLNLHSRVHANEKPYHCKKCDKRFAHSTVLLRHLYSHKDGKPMCCHLCSEAFTKALKAVEHQRTHAGEKPYRCKLCGKSFGRLWSYNKHKQLHKKQLVYECAFCRKGFVIPSLYARHLVGHRADKRKRR